MISALVRLGLFLFFPRIIKLTVGAVKNRKNIGKYVRISFRRDALSWALATLSVILFAQLLFSTLGLNPTPNYFRETSTPIDSPAFLVRNHYRTFMENLKGSNPLVASFLNSIDANANILDEGFTVPEEHKTAFTMLKRYEILSRDLKSNENKFIYNMFGEDAYRDCILCEKRNPLDYIVFLLPRIGMAYVFFLVAFGLLCLRSSKKSLAFFGILTALLAACHDGINLYLFTMKTSMHAYDQLFAPNNLATSFEKLKYIRDCIFMIGLLVGFFFEIPVRTNETLDALKTSFTGLQSSINQMALAQLSKNIILSDDEMRKPFIENLMQRSSKAIKDIASLPVPTAGDELINRR